MSVAAPVLEPGATIGILGSGQLGRMLALAAARLGFKCHIFAPDRDSPAFDVVRESTRADYDDEQALARFADSVDVVTYEFENCRRRPPRSWRRWCRSCPTRKFWRRPKTASPKKISSPASASAPRPMRPSPPPPNCRPRSTASVVPPC